MENYTKYQLKSNEELTSLLEGKDNLYVIACNKCFKEFDTIDEPDCDEFLKFAADQGKTVTGSTKVDFLCNKDAHRKKITGSDSGRNRECCGDLLWSWYSDSCRSGR